MFRFPGTNRLKRNIPVHKIGSTIYYRSVEASLDRGVSRPTGWSATKARVGLEYLVDRERILIEREERRENIIGRR
jgi:hypothetical protein